jgi:hypothetical protein
MEIIELAANKRRDRDCLVRTPEEAGHFALYQGPQVVQESVRQVDPPRLYLGGVTGAPMDNSKVAGLQGTPYVLLRGKKTRTGPAANLG